MAPAPPEFPADQSIRAFREAYPLGSANFGVAIGEDGRYQGLIHVPEAHALALEEGSDGGSIAAIARLPATVLYPDENVRRALDVFGASQADTLVVTARGTGQVWARSARPTPPPLRPGNQPRDEGDMGRRVRADCR